VAEPGFQDMIIIPALPYELLAIFALKGSTCLVKLHKRPYRRERSWLTPTNARGGWRSDIGSAPCHARGVVAHH
jgi:hypothetical protein